MQKAPPQSRVAVLGASPNEERYSFKAVQMLKDHGHTPVPVHPKGHVVDGITALKSLTEIGEPVDTLTVYVNDKISSSEEGNIVKLRPRRVIFNPGAENKNLKERLDQEGFETVEACTLVMLRTEQF